ncbi:hypothetical protein [Undibacterium sp. TS12]|uniref:hypothetical protein n=1 Tax=Undibacterium sp. TS12 TaxID=2908202 RepID=UPI001F4CFE91|nr:hypothetical protein [Undibacterium sp. TS12]MCH8618245.1 hypothetical protein [Undibacterium sp. TS12]
MTEANLSGPENLPDSLAEMLPVGMISAGGLAAAAMATVAQRQFGQDGWQAFHYERISATEFEITGGIAVQTSSGSARKFQGAHDTVIIREADILAEMRRQIPADVATPLPDDIVTIPVSHGKTATPLLKVVFSLPEDEVGRQRILRAFQLQADFFGAKVQACSLHDASLLKLD